MSGINFDSRISYEPYHVYFDINILNNDTTGTQIPPNLQFTEIRNIPFLANPSDYFASVVRFNVETPTLPLVIPQARVGASVALGTINDTVYTVSMSYTVLGVEVVQTTRVLYVPQSSASLAPPPAVVANAADIINEYYYTYSYKPFIDMINTALRTCFTAFIALAGIPLIAPYTAADFPYLWWDEDANIATWVVPAQLFQTPTANNPTPLLLAAFIAGGPIKLFFNAPLFNLFSSFSAFQNGYLAPIPAGLNWRMNFPDTITVNPYLIDTPFAAGTLATFPLQVPLASGPPQQPIDRSLLRVSQEYCTTPLWCPVQSIVFTTSLLPIASSIISTPVLFGAGATFTTAGSNSGIANILTDFEVALEKGWQFKPTVSYSPTAEYRLFDINGNAPLSAIELSVNWKDTFGRLNPLRLGSGCNASLKLMFRRKDFQGVV
jgi:hypothetical protein